MDLIHRRLHFRSTPWYLSGNISPNNCIAAYQPKGASSLSNSYINLNNPSIKNATPGTAPTLTSGGWSFDTTSTQYLDTGIAASSVKAVILRYTGLTRLNDTVRRSIMGGRNATATTGVTLYSDAELENITYVADLGSRFISSNRLISSGTIVLSGSTCIVNGTTVATSFSGNPVGSYTVYIGNVNNGGTLQTGATITILAAAFYSQALTADQITAITSDINNI